MTNILKPVQEPFAPEIQAILARYPQGRDGYILQLFRVFANSMRFLTNAARRQGVVNLLDKDSPVTLREREIVILRCTANANCEYEWGVHVTTFAAAAGFTDEQVAATRNLDGHAACWTPAEALLVRCVDDLCTHAKIQDNNFADFCAQWDLPQQLEILALCGNYHTISFVANTARLAGETGMATFPPPMDSTSTG